MAQAEFLVGRSDPDEASVRRAVSTAYYALFHLLVRDAVVNWKHTDHHSRLARAFDHKRMKEASTTIFKDIGGAQNPVMPAEEQEIRFKLSTVAQAFVDLQQARHKADYDIADPFDRLDAAIHVAHARMAFLNWADIREAVPAQGYLYSLLFRERF